MLLGPPYLDMKTTTLDMLPGILCDLHQSIPPELSQADMRLVPIEVSYIRPVKYDGRVLRLGEVISLWSL